MGKRGKSLARNSIYKRILFPVIVLLLGQALLYPIVFQAGGFYRKLRENAFTALSERVSSRKNYLENDMNHRWANFDESQTKLLALIDGELEDAQRTYADIHSDAALNARLLSAVYDELVYMLRKHSVTDAFIILDGPSVKGRQDAYAGLYIRDADPTTYSDEGSDLLLERGLPALSKEKGVPLDGYWQGSFTFEDGETPRDFFFKPLEAARAADQEARGRAADFGYWSQGFCLNPKEALYVNAYSRPLIAGDGTVIGVLGIGLTQSYLGTQLPYRELSDHSNAAYILGITTDGGQSIEPVAVSGPIYTQFFRGKHNLKLGSTDWEGIVALTPDVGNQAVYASLTPLRVYDRNSQFEQEQWVLLGVMGEDELLAFSKSLYNMFNVIMGVTVLLGTMVAIILAKRVTQPIRTLVVELRASDPDESIRLRKVDIAEIDALSDSIEALSRAVKDSASKISKIVAMTGTKFGVFEFKSTSRVYCSEGLMALLGVDEDRKTGSTIAKEDFSEAMRRLSEHKQTIMGEAVYKLPDEDGGIRYLRMNTLKDGENTLGTLTDVTHEIEEKLKMEYERNYDVLTNLYNLRAFRERTSDLFDHPEALKSTCLIMWDLDNLKYINDNYGHEYGDLYIQTFSKRLMRFEVYGGFSARRSGDEFYTLLPGMPDKNEARQVLREMWNLITTSMLDVPGGQKVRVRVSGGIAWYPEDSRSFEDLLRYADFAMYSGKRSRKGVLLDFSPSLYADEGFLLSGQEKFNQLLEEGLMNFAFQPIVRACDGAVYGYEMLMRSQLPEIRSPLEILRFARAQGKLFMVERLTWFGSMRAFCAAADQGIIPEDAHVFINSIASEALSEADMEQFVGLFGSRIPRIVLELTESEPMNAALTQRKRDFIQAQGGQIAIDDFGSGYSSESVLFSILPDIVKLDMSLVRNIHREKGKQAVLRSLIRYAKKEGIQVLAEGVETYDELGALVELGVDLVQGYLIGKPSLEAPQISQETRARLTQIYAQRHRR